MQLLISVAGPAEARAALSGGADVIDAKDPRRGALGPVPLHRLAGIRAAVAGARPLSAALGDATSEEALAGAVGAAVSVGVAFVKVGFAGVTSETRAGRRVRRGTAGPGIAHPGRSAASLSRRGAHPSCAGRAGRPPGARRRAARDRPL